MVKNNNFKIHFIKSYWSDSILIEYKNKYALIDTGFKENSDYVINYLNENNINDLDFILITHFHCDHYGGLEDILNKIKVGTVYIKEYSGLDCTQSNGKLADDKYRNKELLMYNKLINLSKQKSNYINLNKITKIVFNGIELFLYNNDDIIQRNYEDIELSSYHVYKYSENTNSLVIFLSINNTNIYLAGDITDIDDDIESTSYLNNKIARKINKPIDIYKAAHHGLNNGNSRNILNVIKPKHIVITNHAEDLDNDNNIINYAKRNKINLFYTNETIIFDIDENGRKEVLKCE